MSDKEEIWKDVVGYEGLYKVSSIGSVFSCRLNRMMRPHKNKRGYILVILWKHENNKNFRVHRLVAQAFIENPLQKEDVNHINGVRHDNRVENLEWCTRKENIIHSIKLGLRSNVRRKYAGYRKRKPLTVKPRCTYEIYKDGELIDSANYQIVIADKYGLRQGDISNCLMGRQRNAKGYTFKRRLITI